MTGQLLWIAMTGRPGKDYQDKTARNKAARADCQNRTTREGHQDREAKTEQDYQKRQPKQDSKDGQDCWNISLKTFDKILEIIIPL
jgi:hypothetical protein